VAEVLGPGPVPVLVVLVLVLPIPLLKPDLRTALDEPHSHRCGSFQTCVPCSALNRYLHLRMVDPHLLWLEVSMRAIP